MGSICMRQQPNQYKNQAQFKSKAQEQVYEVDIVKAKLKISRDRVNNMVKAKNNDIAKINARIKELLPEYQQTGNKKKMVPLLQGKRNLQNFVENAEVRVKLLNEKISEVQMQQVNADTINALDDSNKYIKEMQDLMEKKDWQGIVQDAKNKYQLDWPEDDEDIEEDPAFQNLWNQIGGNKLPTTSNKNPSQKNIKVEIPENKQRISSKNLAHA